MGKNVLSSLLLITLPVFAQAQESAAPLEKAALPAAARHDSLTALQKLNHDRSPQAPEIKNAPAGLKHGAEKKEEAPGEELDLGTVSIQAVIEKPNVDIIPKRTEPDWEELGFLERNFSQELKEVPNELMLRDDDLDRAQKLETLKKADPPKEDKKE